MRNVLPKAVFTLLVLIALLCTQQRASACLPGVGHVTAVEPTGQSYPANAALLVVGGVLHFSELQATVDAEPATLSIDEQLSGPLYWYDGGYRAMALRLTPAPAPGARVRVWGNPCAYNPARSCEDFEVEYTASEPDDAAPAPPVEWWWDLRLSEPYPPPDGFYVQDSCGMYPGAGSLDFTVRLAVDDRSQAPMLLRVQGNPSSSGSDPFHQMHLLDHTELSASESLYVDQLRDPPERSAFCVRVTVLDAAGNASDTLERCLPCRVGYPYVSDEESWCFPAKRDCPDELKPSTLQHSCAWERGADAGPPPPNDAGLSDTGSPSRLDAGPSEAGAAQPAVQDSGFREPASTMREEEHANPVKLTASNVGSNCATTAGPRNGHWLLAMLLGLGALAHRRTRTRAAEPRRPERWPGT